MCIRDSLGVDVDEDARVGSLVEGRGCHTAGRGRAAGRDLDVDALGNVSDLLRGMIANHPCAYLRVVLSAVAGARGVKSDDLVADNVVARGERGRDLHGPGVSGRGACKLVSHRASTLLSVPLTDEIVGGPGAGWAGIADQTALVDLGEAEGARSGSVESAADLGDVVDHGTLVGVGPCVPDQGHSVTSLDLDL